MSTEKETVRVEAFSDGVFAFAMTLLALDLKQPPTHEVMSNRALWSKMVEEWPSFLTFFISFGTALTMWVNHHGMFEMIQKVNRSLLFVNGFLVMLIVTVPFTTALLAENIRSVAANTATAIYAGVFMLINALYLLLWHVASRNRALLKPDTPEQAVAHLRRALLKGVVFYVIAFVMAFINDSISVAILTGLWIYWALQKSHKKVA